MKWPLTLSLVVFAVPGTITSRAEEPHDTLPAPPPGKTWKVAWRDEFDGDTLDETKWDVPPDGRRRDGSWKRQAISLDGEGHLAISTLYEGGQYIDGCVRTKGKFEHAFGYYVARISLQREPGHWSAFWLMGDGVTKIGDQGRDGTEIDIMEKPWLDDRVQHALHWDGYGEHHQSEGKVARVPGVMDGFHTFALLWTPEEYVFYVDGEETWRTRSGGVCQVPLYIKLSDEVGTWGGDIRQADLPDRFLVDFVRVYELVDDDAVSTETYSNPVIDDNLADPAVIRHEGTYYLYATGQVDGDNGYRVYTSGDLVHWARGPVVFRPGQPHVWAPDIWRDPGSGRYYLYYTADKTVGVAEADHPCGPFNVSETLFDSAIDAHLFRDDDGRLYLYYVQLPEFRIMVQPMAGPTEPSGEPQVILQPEAVWETRSGRVTEGPWIIKHDGRYYLLYSGSGADTADYAVGYATSTCPLGPFTRADHNPILHRSDGLFGPGHGCALRDDAGQWWHVYHQKRTARREWDRFICVDPLHFDEDGQLTAQATRSTTRPAPVVCRP